ncbi:MAG: hypothetical protein J6W64_08465 [Bacilli bacterium]|nr:hypothetical protein [Bacilli bacterium]MBO7536086.1 hypothetical protein [Bacilli bacterium]
MLNEFLKKNITSQAEFIQENGYGYGQVEPNHLSAQRTAQVYAQLPAAADIEVLEQGQFVKYDYVDGVCNFGSEEHETGEWMLVFNEIKLYRENQLDCEFAMIKDNYQARVYSPFGGDRDGNPDTVWNKQSRYYNGKDSDGHTSITLGDKTYPYDDVTAGPDYYEPHYNEDPFHIESFAVEKMMPAGTQMVPRVFKTNVGDIMTTNTLGDTSYDLGDIVSPRAEDGILCKAGDESMKWQVVKIYTMPDHQPGIKLMRIA